MKTHQKLILIGIVLPFFILGCSQSPVGIFASIAREQEVVDERELDNSLTISGMAKAGGKYFIAAGLLYYRDIDYGQDTLSQWEVVDGPGSDDDNYVTNSVVAFGGNIYATFTSQDGTESGVYQIDPNATPPQRTKKVFGTDAVESVGKLFAIDDGTPRLLVSAQATGGGVSYSLYYSDDPGLGSSSFNEIAGTAAGAPWIDVADNGSEVFYLSPVKALLDSDGVGGGAPSAPVALAGTNDDTTGKPGDHAFTGAHFDTESSTLWLADNDGYLYSSGDFGSSWTRNSSAYRYENESDNETIDFTDIQSVGSGSNRIVVVGTKALGYYLLGANAEVEPESPGSSAANYRESDLSDTAVNGFFADVHPTGHYLFALTARRGLWRGKVDDEPIVWIQE